MINARIKSMPSPSTEFIACGKRKLGDNETNIGYSSDKRAKTTEYTNNNSNNNNNSSSSYKGTRESIIENNYKQIHNKPRPMPTDEYLEQITTNLINRDFGFLKLLIENGADINAHNSLILRTAYLSGNIAWIDYFISKGAKLGVGEYNGVHEACTSDKLEVLQHYFAHGGVVANEAIHNGINAACKMNNFEMIKMLVEHGADLSNVEKNGIKEAFSRNNHEIIRHLIQNNANFDGLENTLLEIACWENDIALVKLVLSKIKNINRLNYLCVFWVCVINNPEIFDLLLSSGLRLAVHPKTFKNNKILYDCLYQACLNTSPKMLKRLVTNIKGLFTCDEFDKTEEAILRKGNLELAKEFFENSGNLDIDYNRGMHMAYKNGDLEIIRMIILRDFGVYIKDPVLITVICHSNNTCLLKYMFRKHQYIGAKKNHGIMEAYYNKNVEMMKLLISSGVNVDIYDCLALKLAFKLNDIDFAKFLLAFNPDYPNNFLRKLKKIVIGNSRKKPDVNNKRYSIARCILSS